MKIKISIYCIIALTQFLVISCGKKSEASIQKGEIPIVSVGNKTLYGSELNEAIPDGINPADSIEIAESYIQKWINDELTYEIAKRNVPDQKHIDQLVEDYKQALTIFTYKEQLLKEELSKKLSEGELKSYYDNNSDAFKLEYPLIKGLFLKIPETSLEIDNFRQWYKTNSVQAKENIEKAYLQNAVIYEYFYDRWLSSDEITNNLPVPIGDASQFVKSNKNYETRDSIYVYLLHIEEYKQPGELIPFEYAKPQITDMLLNKHRESFLKKFNEDLYKNAIDDDKIKYYIERPDDKTKE